jgi:hypothetical protein
LLGVVQLGGATGFFPEDIVDIPKACSNMSRRPAQWQSWAKLPLKRNSRVFRAFVAKIRELAVVSLAVYTSRLRNP